MTVEEIKEKIRLLDEGITFIRSLIAVEQINPVDEAEQRELSLSIDRSEKRLAEIDARIDEAKTKVRAAKERITARKGEYQALSEDMKKDNWSLLSEEVSDDHDAIVNGQNEIGALEKEKFTEYQNLQQLQQKLRAAQDIQSGTEDPRLQAALREREGLVHQLETLQ